MKYDDELIMHKYICPRTNSKPLGSILSLCLKYYQHINILKICHDWVLIWYRYCDFIISIRYFNDVLYAKTHFKLTVFQVNWKQFKWCVTPFYWIEIFKPMMHIDLIVKPACGCIFFYCSKRCFSLFDDHENKILIVSVMFSTKKSTFQFHLFKFHS